MNQIGAVGLETQEFRTYGLPALRLIGVMPHKP